MPARLAFPLVLAAALWGPGARAQATLIQATADGADGRTGTGATLSSGSVRPLADPSQPCRHGADGLPGQGDCPGGKDQPVVRGVPADPPPFTGGVFGPGGRGPDRLVRGPA